MFLVLVVTGRSVPGPMDPDGDVVIVLTICGFGEKVVVVKDEGRREAAAVAEA